MEVVRHVALKQGIHIFALSLQPCCCASELLVSLQKGKKELGPPGVSELITQAHGYRQGSQRLA